MIFIGQNLEEALDKAVEATGKKIEELIYESQIEKGGFFKPSSVMVDVKGFKEKGKIGILDGKIQYIKGDTEPEIIPTTGVIIRVNSVTIDSKTIISEKDNVEVFPLFEEEKREISLKISEDALEVYLTVEYEPQRIYSVVDASPVESLCVQGILISEKWPVKFTIDDVKDLLSKNKITFGINYDGSAAVLEYGGTCLVAMGIKPEKSINDKINYFFNKEKKRKPVEVNGKVDYYNVGEIEYIEENQIIAERVPGRDGESGYDIFGNIVKPEKRVEVKLLVGPGSKISKDGNSVTSEIRGIPSIKDGRLCVYPVVTYNSDIDIKTGNILFDGGDVFINGNVKEGLKIEAANNVDISGYVCESKVTAGGNINIGRNVISSTITAGNKQIEDMILLKYIKMFSEFLNGMMMSFFEIKKSGKLRNSVTNGMIFKVILESKLRNCRDEILEGNDVVKRLHIKDEDRELWQSAYNCYLNIVNGVMNESGNLVLLKKEIDDYVISRELIFTPADIVIGYCQNSTLSATNNVEIKGKGCYNTNITAENIVKFTGIPGVIRGGQIYGENGVFCREIGSNAGVITIVRAGKEGVIEAERAYQNTIFCFGNLAYRVDNPIRNVKACVSKGEIVVDKFNL